MTNYVQIYKLQEGGQMPAPAQDPQAELSAMVNEILSTQNCEMALQFVQMIGEQMGVAPAAPAQEAPAESTPVFAKGGKMMYRKPKGKEMKKGGAMKATFGALKMKK